MARHDKISFYGATGETTKNFKCDNTKKQREACLSVIYQLLAADRILLDSSLKQDYKAEIIEANRLKQEIVEKNLHSEGIQAYLLIKKDSCSKMLKQAKRILHGYAEEHKISKEDLERQLTIKTDYLRAQDQDGEEECEGSHLKP